jgi:hypothetical protein
MAMMLQMLTALLTLIFFGKNELNSLLRGFFELIYWGRL